MEIPIHGNNDINLNDSLYDDYQNSQQLNEHIQLSDIENVLTNEGSEVNFILKV